MMEPIPSLDAHAHIDPCRSSDELNDSGSVLAMTLFPDEWEIVIKRQQPHIVWGIGCHPRFSKAQESFDVKYFRTLAEKTALVGEIGLDTGSHVPLETQIRTFRQILDTIADLPRIVSIHSYRATGLVLKELRRQPITTPILHGWTGTASETSEAVELGCYFSIHSAVARQSKFRTRVPVARVLVESDHGYNDPPAAIPLRVGWAEHLVAQQYKLDVKELRQLIWKNFVEIAQKTETIALLPHGFVTADTSPGMPG
jgi:TatD DNase family protein